MLLPPSLNVFFVIVIKITERKYLSSPILSVIRTLNIGTMLNFNGSHNENELKQECIPVGCVPAARRPYAGVCFRGGLPGPGGVSAWSGGWGGVCLVRGDVSAWSRGGVCLVGGGVWHPSMH